MSLSLDPSPRPQHLILVDGTCVFCNRLVAFILERDRAGVFAFTHIQSGRARSALERYGSEPDVDRIFLLADFGSPEERLLVDGAAGRVIWPALFRVAVVLRWVPLFLLNAGYVLFSRIRYRLFGQYDQCLVPTPEQAGRFLSDRDSTGA